MRKPLPFSLTAVLAFCVVIVVILLLFWSGSSQKQPLIPDIPQEETSSSSSTNNLDYLQVEITPQNVQSVIAALSRPDSYYIETKSELYYDDRNSAYLRRKWTRGSWSRVDLFNAENTVTMHVIFTDQSAFFWYPDSSRYTRLPAGDFTADEVQMMMTYEDILELKEENIIDAKLTRLNGEDCVYAEVVRPELGYTERYWVSAANGLLLLGQTLKDGDLIYSVQMIEMDPAIPGDDVFMLPGNQFLGDMAE